MSDLPREPTASARSAAEVADLERERAVAKAGYQGLSTVSDISEAMKKRSLERAERERQDAKVHYLGTTPQKPR